MTDLLWCEAHKQRAYSAYCDSDQFGPCSIVRLVESRDSEGLLLGLPVQEECGKCGGQGWVVGMGHDAACWGTRCDLHGCPVQIQEHCPQCDGSGWRYRADLVTRKMGGFVATLNPTLAVLPLPDKETPA